VARLYTKLEQAFAAYLGVLWPHLSRFNNLMIITNLSLFFLTGLVQKGYYFTFLSMGCFTLVALMILIPTPFLGRLRFYLLSLFFEFLGLYFLVASIIYWIQHEQV
jgi:hypothetical protein